MTLTPSPAASFTRDTPRIAILAALLLLVLYPASRPAADPDIFFHLRMGDWIVGHGKVPDRDPFARHDIEPGLPGTAYSWLFDVGASGIYRADGFAGIMIATMLLGTAAALILLGLPGRGASAPDRMGAVLGLSLLTLWPMMTPRPWLLSIVFFGLELRLITRVRSGGRPGRLFLLVPLFALWANLHIEFTHGLLLLGLFYLDRLGRWRTQDMGVLVAAGFACAFATLVNPYGIGVWRVVLQYLTQGSVTSQIAEVSPPDFKSVPEWTALVLAGWAVWTLRRRRGDRRFGALVVAAGLALYLHSRRDMWFLVFGAASVILGAGAMVPAEGKNEVERAPDEAPPAPAAHRSPFPRRIWLPAVVLSLVLLVAAGHGRGFHDRWHREWMRRHYPVDAAAFVKRELWKPAGEVPVVFAGPLYNSFEWGSFLIWALPELPVSIDGRTNVRSSATILRQWATWEGEPGWQSDPYLASANLVLLERAAPLTTLLRDDPRFLEVYEDSTRFPGAIVFARIAGG